MALKKVTNVEKPKGAHTRTSLASESGWARVPMSQTRPCVECHEPDLADSGLDRQGLRWGSARRRLATGSYVCGRSDSRIHMATNTDSANFVTKRRNHVGYHV